MMHSPAKPSSGPAPMSLAAGVLLLLVMSLAGVEPYGLEVVLIALALVLVLRLAITARRERAATTRGEPDVAGGAEASAENGDALEASEGEGVARGGVALEAKAASEESGPELRDRQALVVEYRRRVAHQGVGDSVGVLLVDVDRFKVTNDSLGRAYGDQLLGALGRRLQRAVRPGDIVGTLGADEFLILCDGVGHLDDAVGVAQQIHRAVAQPFNLVDHTVTVTVSIGVTVAGESSADEAFSNAGMAMIRAKSQGGATTEVFDSSIRHRVFERAAIEQELRRALQRDELTLVYQPIVDLVDGRMAAAEALVRWDHPERGRLSPAQFLPVAEESGLIVPLGEMVLAKACHAQVEWRMRMGDLAPTVTVNLSLRQLQTPDFVARVRVHVVESGIDPSQLILEVTEDSLVNELEYCIPILSELAAIGLGVAIDDFGTGMSSLSYVKRLPMARTLKLDRSFISDIHEYRTDHAIVQAVLVMTERLGIRVVAEGVETSDQLAALIELGGRYVQGFFFSPPLEAESLVGYAPDLVRVHGLSMGPIS